MTRRKLTTLEATFYEMNKSQPFIIIMGAHVSGSLSHDLFEEALSLMQIRHKYYLFHSIETVDGILEWVYDENSKIPVTYTSNSSQDHWVEVCNFEMNYSLPLKEAPLMKVIFLEGVGYADIIFKFSHIIADGISVYNFIKDLFLTIENLYFKKKVSFSYDLKEIFPDKTYFPKYNHEKFFFPQEENTVFDGLPSLSIEQRRTNILPYGLNFKDSQKLISKSKEHDVTVNSLLIAALVLNLKKYIVEKKKIDNNFVIKSSAGVNGKGLYQVSLKPEQLGSWAGFGYVFFESNEITNLVTSAKLFQKRLSYFIDKNFFFEYLSNFIESYAQKNSIEKVTGRNVFYPYVLLTNLGKMELKIDYSGIFRLTRISFMTPMHRHWPNDLSFGLCANSLAGETSLIFNYMSPAWNLKDAEQFADEVVYSLTSEN